MWDELKFRNTEKDYFVRTDKLFNEANTRGQVAFFQDLLTDGFDFVLTVRLQSDPLERFLLSAKEGTPSENILKLKSLVEEALDIGDLVKFEDDFTEDMTKFLTTLKTILVISML